MKRLIKKKELKSTYQEKLFQHDLYEKVRFQKKSSLTKAFILTTFLLTFLLIATTSKNVSAATVESDETVNGVRQYVISPGGEDDYKIIERCLSSNGDSGVNITLMPGTYNLIYSLKVFNNTTITATGATIIQTADGKGLLINARYAGSKYGEGTSGYTSCENITIDGGTWIGTYKPDTTKTFKDTGYYVGYSSIMFMHGKNITVKNASFKHNYNGHFIEFAGINNGKIINCNLNMSDSIYVGEPNNEAIQIDNTYAQANSPVGSPWDDTACQNITIQGCNIKYVRGIGTNRIGNSPFVNIKVLYNTIVTTKGEGVNAYDIKGFTADHNTIKVTHKKDDYTSVGLYLGLSSKMSNWGTYSTMISNNKITGYSAGLKIVGFNGATFNKITLKNNTFMSTKDLKSALVLAYSGKQILQLINVNNILKKVN
ncbi:hypothetical protein [Anaeromicropila herbilytica]|uniref:Right handed beta helix domain-containing protein n=1 Tax=Anaeromicropila herbilytica TaxID=2785025 RepID=A0A7R7ENE4_9FIRM|nr:hypothetical protein [Anaeromicropila herbilytica]BCN32055.1 hypothetical protein bsdtb5_33500 [Anaeromicropila herbilytica]